MLNPIKWVGAHPNNFTGGRDGKMITGFIIHATQGSMQSAASWFNDARSKVSAHYGIDKKGNIEQYVNDADTAHHAGNYKVNQRTLSIEFEDVLDGVDLTPEQYAQGAALIRAKAEMYRFKIDESTIEPHNKYRATECPGDVQLPRLISLAQEDIAKASRALKIYQNRKHLQTVYILEGQSAYTKTDEKGNLFVDIR